MSKVSPPHLLIIEARFYEDIADELVRGAIAAIDDAGATFDRLAVPGALEIPSALSIVADAGLIPFGGHRWRYHGAVALGTVIRGETTHYELVANESTRWLMHLAVSKQIAIGNGILTVENADQAWARARGGLTSKGADAVRACLALIGLNATCHGRS